MNKSSLGFTLLLLAALCASPTSPSMVPRTVPQTTADKHGAKCLGGQAPAIEIRRNASSTSWVLFLEGGGWCNGATANATIDSCAGRGGFVPPHLTTTATTADFGGVLGANPTTNPDFFTWNAVFIHYCDGASFGSGRVDPIAVKKRDGSPGQLWMRGRANFNAVIDDLLSTQGMRQATEVILSGGSAGGLAVFYNLDHLVTLLPAGVRVTGFPDAGFFMDAPGYVADFQGADPVWNVTGSGGTNLKCLAAHAAAGEQWRCLLAPFILPHIEAPIYVMNSAYDAYQLGNEMNPGGCVPTPAKPCNVSATLAYGQALKDRVRSTLAARPSTAGRAGAYIDSCYVHEQNVNYCSAQGMPNCVGWTPAESGSKKWGYSTAVTTPEGKQLTPQQAFGKFYFRKSDDDAVLIDSTILQQNPTCIWKGPP